MSIEYSYDRSEEQRRDDEEFLKAVAGENSEVTTRRRGRPNKENARTHTHSVKLNDEERDLLRALVVTTGMTESEVFRTAMKSYGSKRLLKRKKVK